MIDSLGYVFTAFVGVTFGFRLGYMNAVNNQTLQATFVSNSNPNVFLQLAVSPQSSRVRLYRRNVGDVSSVLILDRVVADLQYTDALWKVEVGSTRLTVYNGDNIIPVDGAGFTTLAHGMNLDDWTTGGHSEFSLVSSVTGTSNRYVILTAFAVGTIPGPKPMTLEAITGQIERDTGMLKAVQTTTGTLTDLTIDAIAVKVERAGGLIALTRADVLTRATPGDIPAPVSANDIAVAVDTRLALSHGAGEWDSQVVLAPLNVSLLPTNQLGNAVDLELFKGESRLFSLAIATADGTPVDLTGRTLRFIVQTRSTSPLEVFTVDGASITYDGDNNEIAKISVDDAVSNVTTGDYEWRLWDVDVKAVLSHGSLTVLPALYVEN
jgi:hypothetical protein